MTWWGWLTCNLHLQDQLYRAAQVMQGLRRIEPAILLYDSKASFLTCYRWEGLRVEECIFFTVAGGIRKEVSG